MQKISQLIVPLAISLRSSKAHSPCQRIVLLKFPSCLYHTFKILLYRPMLFQRSCNIAQQRPDPNHLVECISSATSIIAIFDLFCRTFGDDYCILSLSYSVYTAASIFLLQVQAATGPVAGEEMTVRRLEFCIRALERVGRINPGKCRHVQRVLFDLSAVLPLFYGQF